jgi:Tfp pilus assembly protein PilF
MRKTFVTALMALSATSVLQACGGSMHEDAAKRLEDASDWAGAINEYKLALASPDNKRSAPLHLQLAHCYFNYGQMKEAEEECKASIDCDSKLSDAHMLLAQCFQKHDAKNEALEQYTLAAVCDDKNAVPLIEAGKILQGNGDLKGAAAKFEAATKADPNSADAHELYAKALGLLGDMKKAGEEMKIHDDLKAHPPKPKESK